MDILCGVYFIIADGIEISFYCIQLTICLCFEVMALWPCRYIKTYVIIHFKYMQCIVCLSKAVCLTHTHLRVVKIAAVFKKT